MFGKKDDCYIPVFVMDEHNITYASQGDYMRSKVAFNAKDTEIADLSNKVRELEKQIADSNKTGGNHKTELDKCHKDLERFYLEAIGNANTVKQVNAVVKRYYKSELYKALVSQIDQAAATKIKRINRRDVEEVCDLLDTLEDNNYYASSMASTLKEVAGVEVDRTKILEAKQTGLDAWNVLLSLLSANGIKHDDVLGVR